ncbi:MAG TPA: hypothetical protein GXX53_06825 [Tissierellia bacterium]|nr:hypothetical protein [Tissierellia bacterium]
MNSVRHSLLLNLSNQANTFGCKGITLSQYNFVTILGFEYLNGEKPSEMIPISINIDKDWNLSIEGFGENIIDDGNIYVYTDKKVTKSDDQ